jgi:hypothetical protein
LDFQLNEEQLHLKKSVREFAEREIAPNVMKWDEACEFPLATIKELGKLGLMGMIFPPEYGGAGMGYVEYVTAVAELSRVDGSVGIIVAAHTSLCSNHIYVAGNEAQKKKYVPKLATGEYIGAWGLTEPSAGSDAGSARMTAGDHRSRRPYARPLGVHRREGCQGIPRREKRKQTRPARQRHLRVDLRRLLREGRKPPRQGRRRLYRRHARS